MISIVPEHYIHLETSVPSITAGSSINSIRERKTRPVLDTVIR